MTGQVAVVVLVDFAQDARIKGFAHLAFGRFARLGTPGLAFAKSLGSGAGAGFGVRPSATHQGLFLGFDDDASADRFLERARTMRFLEANARELAAMKLRAYASRGTWSGRQPVAVTAEAPDGGPVASLTRASIRPTLAHEFWRHAPPSEVSLRTAEGCLLSAGLGEAPLFRQATFTVWDSERSMVAYARQGAHAAAIRDAYGRTYFSESLFARFVPYGARGRWAGRDMAALGVAAQMPAMV